MLRRFRYFGSRRDTSMSKVAGVIRRRLSQPLFRTIRNSNRSARYLQLTAKRSVFEHVVRVATPSRGCVAQTRREWLPLSSWIFHVLTPVLVCLQDIKGLKSSISVAEYAAMFFA